MTAEESSAVIRARGLGKTYESKAGPIEAVSGLDLEVREGEIFGLLGPNGA
ncbi:MAG TPA: multidrug ABC transporter ATP-binding protein, partial [Planctomycetes bacterium]|nr:multidrug ABC transporter ATP-binding protein [Planctomycetota bacterium]